MSHRKSHSQQGSHASRTARTAPPAHVDDVDIGAQVAGAVTKPNGELRGRMVAEAAYYRALNRGFNGGDPNEDWFAAEREIDERFGNEH